MSAEPLRRNRNFVLLQIGQALSTLGSESSLIAYPLLVLAVTHSPAKAGIVGFLRFLPYVLVAIPAGVAVDRWNRKRIMLIADSGRVLALTSIVVALAMHDLTFAQIAVVALVEGTLYTFFNIAEVGALRAVVARSDLPRAAAAEQARIATVALAGGPLGGALFGITRLLPFLVDAISYCFSFISLLAINTPFQEQRLRAQTRATDEIREGFRWMRANRFIWTGQLLGAGANLGFEALLLTLIVVSRRHGLSSAAIGAFFALFGATMLLGSLVAPTLQRVLSLRTIMLLEPWLMLAVVPFVFEPSPFVLLGCALPSLFIVPTVSSSMIGYRNGIAPDRLVGRINSVARTLAIAGAPMGSLSAGLLLGAWSPRVCVAVLLAWSLVLALWTAWSPTMRAAPSLDEIAEASTAEASPATAG